MIWPIDKLVRAYRRQRSRRLLNQAFATYDAAAHTRHNERHWANADALSAHDALAPHVRATIRNRARYVTHESNSLICGIVRTLANDTIGTGPRLQLSIPGRADAAQEIERKFRLWTYEIRWAEKLRTLRIAKCIDEGFAVAIANRRLAHPVKLDYAVVESDRVRAPFDRFGDPRDADGIRFDDAGNPVSYTVFADRPNGVLSFNDFEVVPASNVIHLFRADRPGQRRGTCEFATALELVPKLQRWTNATILAAETAANHAGILYTEEPDPDGVQMEPGDAVDTEPNALLVLANGRKLAQLKAEHPSTTFPMLYKALAREIARCLLVPVNVALEDSSDSNFSSARLDHQFYDQAIAIERDYFASACLDPTFLRWLEFASAIPDYLPALLPDLSEWDWVWFWDSRGYFDPSKEGSAIATNLASGVTNRWREHHRLGLDVEEEDRRAAATFGVSVRDYRRALFSKTFGGGAGAQRQPPPRSESDDSEETDEDDEMANAQAPRTICAAASPTLTFDVKVDIQAAKEEGKRPTFAMTAYTGAPISVGGFFTPVIVDLSGFKSGRSRIPILLNHDSEQIVGQTDEIRIDASGAFLAGTLLDSDASERVARLATSGFEWQASIGASIVRQEFLKAGEKAVVNGREVAGPMLIAREARLNETSFVAVGADAQTSVSVAANQPPPSSGENPMGFDEWVKARGFDPDKLTEDQKKPLKAAYDAEQKNPDDNPGNGRVTATRSLDEIVETHRRERDRQETITRMTDEACRDNPARIDEFKALAQAAIEGKHSIQEFKLVLLEARLSRVTPGGAAPSDPPRNTKVIEAAICKSLRMEGLDKTFDERTLDATDRYFRDGIGLQQLLFMAAAANGQQFTSARNVRALLEAVFPPPGLRAAGFSTLSLPGILSNVMNKMLVDYFSRATDSADPRVPRVWSQIASIRPVSNFQQVSTYSLTGDLTYELLPPSGEIKHGQVGETAYTNKADTYAKMMAVTRHDIINDDLGALQRAPQRLGRGGALAIFDQFWRKFLNNAAFFVAGNNNVSTGVFDATGDALKAAEIVFANQTDPDGKPLGVAGRKLVVPSSHLNTGLRLMNSTLTVGGGTNVADENVLQGRYQVLSSQYMENPTYTGFSALAWYLLADPLDIAVIEGVFLNGRMEPTVESTDADFNQLGIQVRAFHDFGFNLQEPRGGVRGTGAAP